MVTQLFGITMPSDQLSTVVSAFTHWRNNKTGLKTPSELRQQAVALKKSYSASKITKALNLSGGQFNKWCQQSESAALPVFVNLPAVANSPPTTSVEVFFNSGERLFLNDSDPVTLASLVQALKA
jgi:hypothetical protein